MIRSNPPEELEQIIDDRVKPSAVKALNLWNGRELGLIGLSINAPPGRIQVEFINRAKANKAWEAIRQADSSKIDEPKMSMSMKGRISFEILSDDLIHFLPEQELVDAGVEVGALKVSLEGARDETTLCDILVGAEASSPPELSKLFKQKFKQTYDRKTPPVQRFNEDFFRACLGNNFPRLVSIKPIHRPATYSTDKATLCAYVGQVALEFKSPEECELFSEQLCETEELRPKKWTGIEPDRAGKVMILDMCRLRDLYPTDPTGFSSHSDYIDYLDKVESKLNGKDGFLFELNNFLADIQFDHRILNLYFHAPRGVKPDEIKLRCHFREKQQAEHFTSRFYSSSDDKPQLDVVKARDGSYYIGIPPTQIYQLLDSKSQGYELQRQARDLFDEGLMLRHAVKPMQLFKHGLTKFKTKATQSPPDFRANPKKIEEYVKQAVSGVNVTGEENFRQWVFRKITRKEKEYAWLTLKKVTVNGDGSVEFSLRAEEQGSLDKFKSICLRAGCVYSKINSGNEFFREEKFTFSSLEMERFIKYLEEHPELIHKDQSLDFSTLRLGEAQAYSETVLRFQSDIDKVKNNEGGSAADASKKAERLCEFLRDGFAYHEDSCSRFNVSPENYRLSYERRDTNAWQLQQVVPGDGDKQTKIVTVACATKPGIELSDDVILHTLKQAIVAELFKSYLEGKRGPVDVKLDITDRLGGHVSEEMLARIKNLAETKHFTRQELEITEEMVAKKNFPDGEEVSLHNLWLNGTCVNSYADHPTREQGTDKQYASPEDWRSNAGLVMGRQGG